MALCAKLHTNTFGLTVMVLQRETTLQRMQSKSSPSHEGVLMHISAVKAWEAETGRSCGELLSVYCKGKGAQSSAFYSCRVDEFA
jgi:hypothetical protein